MAARSVSTAGESARVELKAAAMLPEVPDPKFHNLRYDEKPYWHVERARIPGTREVPVELIVNGLPVATRNLPADGRVHDLEFNVPIKEKQLDRRADSGFVAHQSDLRPGRAISPCEPRAAAPSGCWPRSISAGHRKRRALVLPT